MPEDYAALVLIGGFGWIIPVAQQIVPIVRKAINRGKIVGAICNGASFMAKAGFLNNVKHTGNGLEQLQLWGGDNYTNPDGYVHVQASAITISLRQTVLRLLNLQRNFCCCLRTIHRNV